MSHAVITPKTYVVIFVALLGLTGATYLLADVPLSALGHVGVALSIAGFKTVLVGLFFMHLLHSPKLTWLIVLYGVLFLGIMVIGILADYWTRNLDYLPQSWSPPPP